MAKFITPAVTPLNEDRTPDFAAMQKLYDHVITGGVDGILVLGSIGEFFGFSFEMKKEIIKNAIRIVDHRVQLIVGTAGTVFDEVIELSKFALAEGADAVIVVPPYYFTIAPESIEQYYDAIAERVDGPVYIYNFPDRTGYEIPVQVIKNLALKHKNIVGCKDTISGMDHTRELIKAIKPERPEFEIYSGFDDNFAHNVLSGGDGCIGGLSNLVPGLVHAWVNAVNSGDFAESAVCQQKINRLMDIYGVGVPFVPFIKKALDMCGVGVQEYATVPLPVANESQTAKLKEILVREGVLN